MKFNNLVAKLAFIIALSIPFNAMDDYETTKQKKYSVCFWNTFIYSIDAIKKSTSPESRALMEEQTLKLVQAAIKIDDVTQDELDLVFNASLEHGLFKMTECLLTLPGESAKKPKQHIVDKAVSDMFGPLMDVRYRAKLSNLFMRIASSEVGSYMEIKSALKSNNKK